MALVRRVRPDQCTLVPVLAGEVTSQGGWPAGTPVDELRRTIAALRGDGIRVSVFLDPDPSAVRWAAALGADRVELFTEPYARAFAAGPAETEAAMQVCAAAAEEAHALGLGVNAGHDLDHRNLVRFRELPHLAEVSIGHALISRALFDGLAPTVRAYLDVLQ
jgi:pyridoxine 5-phosphate synthase